MFKSSSNILSEPQNLGNMAVQISFLSSMLEHMLQVTASGLLGLVGAGEVVEGEGEPELSGACIHLGVRRVRPTARVVMHTHTPYATALGCLEDPQLLPVHQNSCR